ncbi:hypothetical protein BGZ63DRAFT_454644 [Mariannaea sp. PMI_226]|nr:hypothetical protein BGZ63DRAFT_454644 [Mariannaea sp. PMI_226]
MAQFVEAAAPLTLNQWLQRAQVPPAASATPWSSTSRASSATPSSHHSSSHYQDALGLLHLLPAHQPDNDNNNNHINHLIQHDNSPPLEFTCDFATAGSADFNFANTSPDLFLSGVALDGDRNEENWLADNRLLDPSIDLSGGGVMIPDMATQTASSLGMGDELGLALEDEFFSQETNSFLQVTLERQAPASSVSTFAPSSTNNPMSTSTTTQSPSYAPNSTAFSTFAINLTNRSSSDSPTDSSSSGGAKRKSPSSPEDEIVARDIKRQRNTMAARKYRQKRLDRVAELEKALADMTNDRDGLRLRLARKEAEVDALREMLGSKK